MHWNGISCFMGLWHWIERYCRPNPDKPVHLKYGASGELAARRYLERKGYKFLVSNFRWQKAEIDLICRDQDCLVFVEVKTRERDGWTRPAAAVNIHKKLLISRAALRYLHLLKNPQVIIRFDIIEVLHEEGNIKEIRHLPNAFSLSAPYRYG